MYDNADPQYGMYYIQQNSVFSDREQSVPCDFVLRIGGGLKCSPGLNSNLVIAVDVDSDDVSEHWRLLRMNTQCIEIHHSPKSFGLNAEIFCAVDSDYV